MNDRAVSLFDKYDITIEEIRKGRGMMIAGTDKGAVALSLYQGSIEHLSMQEAFLLEVAKKYKGDIDIIIRTTEGELFCTDYEGEKYILKKYVEGNECDVTNKESCIQAAGALGRLHKAMRRTEIPEEWMSFFERTDDLKEDFKRRTAEIIRTRNYIRKSPRKEEFELAFLGVYDKYMEQAALACDFLSPNDLEMLAKKQRDEGMMVHGDCTHHNVVFTKEGITFVNFEKIGAHLQVKDIYLFMRKILEKNSWAYDLGVALLSSYEKELMLCEQEKRYLYACFLYPERFRKIASGYLNRPKSVPAKRQQEKLAAFEEKEEKRQAFLNKWVETCR